MEETATSAPEIKARIDVYALITDKICEQLSKGIIPWQKLWGESGPPVNLITKQPYKGINALLLGMEEYENNSFLSFEQVNEIGGKVRRGSKGHTVVHWEKSEKPRDGDDEKNSFWIKFSRVFNVAQCDKIPDKFLPAKAESLVHPTAEQILASMPNPPKIGGKEPNVFYDVVEDMVNMPRKKGAKKDAEYYALLFRQLVHSTGHDGRLARKGMVKMSELAGEPLHSKEDLIAEIGLCFLLSHAGMDVPFRNGAGYAEGWAFKLSQDRKLMVIAAGQAQKAVDYILNVKGDAAKADEKTSKE